MVFEGRLAEMKFNGWLVDEAELPFFTGKCKAINLQPKSFDLLIQMAYYSL